MNPLVSKLKDGLPVHGVLSPSFDPIIVEMLGHTDMDFFMIEGEHAHPHGDAINAVCRAAELSGITPLARVRSGDSKLVLQYLEAGIEGLMLPGVVNAHDVRNLIDAMKYPPQGVRGLGGSRSTRYMMSGKPFSDITEPANQQTFSIIQIETREAYENLESILAVPGIDVVFIGEVDLSLSMGLPFKGNEMEEITQKIIQNCQSKGLPVGVVSSERQQIDTWIKSGVNFFISPMATIVKKGSGSIL